MKKSVKVRGGATIDVSGRNGKISDDRDEFQTVVGQTLASSAATDGGFETLEPYRLWRRRPNEL